MLNATYLIYKDQLPFNAPKWVAWLYVGALFATTIVSLVSVVAILAGAAINPALQFVRYVYVILGLIFPIIFAAVERRNGDYITLQTTASKGAGTDGNHDEEAAVVFSGTRDDSA